MAGRCRHEHQTDKNEKRSGSCSQVVEIKGSSNGKRSGGKGEEWWREEEEVKFDGDDEGGVEASSQELFKS